MAESVHPALARRAREAAAWLRGQEQVTVVCHIDADGVAAGAIAQATLERAGIDHEVLPVKSLDQVHVDRVRAANGALWFCDLGSAAHNQFPDVAKLVCDHHQLDPDGAEAFAHVNPMLDGLDGHTEVSGAGATFLVARAVDEANVEHLPLALVGAAADLQDRPESRMVGSNGAMLADGAARGLVAARTDLGFYGPDVRPLVKWLAFAREPAVPGVTGDRRVAQGFLDRIGVPLLDGASERTWGHLNEAERRTLRSSLVAQVLDCGLGADYVDGLFREVITITAEEPGQPTRELQGFATLLNSTARYDRPEVGLAVARGDRDQAYRQALELLDGHRKHLVGALDAFAKAGVAELAALQWVHLRDRVRDTVVGIVAGMALDGLGLRRDRPLIAFAHTSDGRTKVSSRAPSELAGRINLAAALQEAAQAVGGAGGGHAGAAGATIERNAEEAFLERLDAILASQLGVMPRAGSRVTSRPQSLAEAASAGDQPEHGAGHGWVAGRGQTTLF